MFCPVYINDDIYLDGGIYNNFPIEYFKDNKLHDILGVNIVCKNYQKKDSFFEYFGFIFNSIVKKFNHKSITDLDKNIITLEFSDSDDDSWFSLSEMKITVSNELLEKYTKMGYDEAVLKLTAKNDIKKL
jgi:predicted acylesterase/phospholipase RssA